MKNALVGRQNKLLENSMKISTFYWNSFSKIHIEYGGKLFNNKVKHYEYIFSQNMDLLCNFLNPSRYINIYKSYCLPVFKNLALLEIQTYLLPSAHNFVRCYHSQYHTPVTNDLVLQNCLPSSISQSSVSW